MAANQKQASVEHVRKIAKPMMAAFPRNGYRIGMVLIAIGLGSLIITIATNITVLFDLLAPPAVTYPVTLPVLTPVIHAGDTLVLEVTRCAWNVFGDSPVSATVKRRLVNVGSSAIVVLPSVPVDVDPGCTTVESRLSIIPGDLPPGHWILRGSATARNKTTTFQSEPFEVIP